MSDVSAAVEVAEEFELQQLEQRAAKLSLQWLERIVAEFEEMGTVDIVRAAEQAERSNAILGVLGRTFKDTQRVRSVLQ